ncbi:hypothetical protein KKA39_01185 [Patescibacteria group bacterium]|nr:hypothetical protein [Patescibacteria group bacterium]MBU1727906.1 hypothetical protein [Patescibacteria group bacterium]
MGEIVANRLKITTEEEAFNFLEENPEKVEVHVPKSFRMERIKEGKEKFVDPKEHHRYKGYRVFKLK